MLSDLTTLKGVGLQLKAKLARLHIHNTLDLLFHLPFRYQNRTRVYKISELVPGMSAFIEAEVVKQQIVFGKRRRLEVELADQTGYIYVSLFHFNESQRKQFQTGTRLRCFGEVSFFNQRLQMVHPEYQLIDSDMTEISDTLTPVYPSVDGLSQKTLRGLITQVIAKGKSPALSDDLPILQDYSLWDALLYCHQPPIDANQLLLEGGSHPAQQRLALEELLAHHLSVRLSREEVKQHTAPSLQCSDALLQSFYRNTFTPTQAQTRVLQEILHDVKKNNPMLRLLQGDVGSGKTWVAAGSMLAAIASGYQVALMAPTEILAQQHAHNLKHYFQHMDISLVCLSSRLKTAEKNTLLSQIKNDEAKIIVGTHALIQSNVIFQRLGLVIIDEQHRFGVEQRLALKTKGEHPHQLMMTATPIPRTLAMLAYADLDYSVIDEMPAHRKPITTLVLSNKRRPEIINKIDAHCQKGQQVYWVCTLIEESELLNSQAATRTYEMLCSALPNIKVGLIHGQLKTADKQAIMQAFKQNDIQLLVATTVIEVGVDVANASLMVIENPERLGLAQLHQLRGRVGRGTLESHCILMYQAPISPLAKNRLDVLRNTNDGFKIAEQDLAARGSGELLGTKQSGELGFKIAQITRDKLLLNQVPALATHLLAQQPEKIKPLIARWLSTKLQYRAT